MKKLGKLFLLLTLCLSFVGCSNNKKTTKDIIKDFEKAGYSVNYNEDGDSATVTLGKSSKDKENEQFITYFENKKLDSIVYIKLPENSDSQDMILGYIYASKDSDSEVNKDVKKDAEKILDKLDLTLDDLIDYSKEIFKDKGKSIQKEAK